MSQPANDAASGDVAWIRLPPSGDDEAGGVAGAFEIGRGSSSSSSSSSSSTAVASSSLWGTSTLATTTAAAAAAPSSSSSSSSSKPKQRRGRKRLSSQPARRETDILEIDYGETEMSRLSDTQRRTRATAMYNSIVSVPPSSSEEDAAAILGHLLVKTKKGRGLFLKMVKYMPTQQLLIKGVQNLIKYSGRGERKRYLSMMTGFTRNDAKRLLQSNFNNQIYTGSIKHAEREGPAMPVNPTYESIVAELCRRKVVRRLQQLEKALRDAGLEVPASEWDAGGDESDSDGGDSESDDDVSGSLASASASAPAPAPDSSSNEPPLKRSRRRGKEEIDDDEDDEDDDGGDEAGAHGSSGGGKDDGDDDDGDQPMRLRPQELDLDENATPISHKYAVPTRPRRTQRRD